MKLTKMYLVYWVDNIFGISLVDSRVFINRNTANSYRFRKEEETNNNKINGRYKIKTIYLWGNNK